MNHIIFFIAYIVLNYISTVLGQGYLYNLNESFYPHTTRYRSPEKYPGKKNDTVPNLFPKPENPINSMLPFSFKPGKIVDCRGMTSKIYKMGKEAGCKPKKTLVKLSPDPGYVYIPDTILLDRCGGYCGRDGLSCMPIESTYTKVLVFRIQNSFYDSHCYELEVEKHTKCRCGCDLMPGDCNPRQRYNDENCKCECNNRNEQLECTLKEGMYWNQETCRCSCLVDEETCSDGLTWIPSLCRCAKVMMDYNID